MMSRNQVYVEKMTSDCTWVELFDIHAAALALRIEIIIFSMAEGSRNGAILDCPTVLSTSRRSSLEARLEQKRRGV
jgi:hypothetical protein